MNKATHLTAYITDVDLLDLITATQSLKRGTISELIRQALWAYTQMELYHDDIEPTIS